MKIGCDIAEPPDGGGGAPAAAPAPRHHRRQEAPAAQCQRLQDLRQRPLLAKGVKEEQTRLEI